MRISLFLLIGLFIGGCSINEYTLIKHYNWTGEYENALIIDTIKREKYHVSKQFEDDPITTFKTNYFVNRNDWFKTIKYNPLVGPVDGDVILPYIPFGEEIDTISYNRYSSFISGVLQVVHEGDTSLIIDNHEVQFSKIKMKTKRGDKDDLYFYSRELDFLMKRKKDNESFVDVISIERLKIRRNMLRITLNNEKLRFKLDTFPLYLKDIDSGAYIMPTRVIGDKHLFVGD